MRTFAACLLFAVAATPAFPQQTLVETIEVRVANVDVVVRDKQGNPVTGLTKDDFILYDDRVPQTITNFYEIRRGEDTSEGGQETPVELRQRRIVFFVDAMSLTPSRKKQVLQSVGKFVDSMQPEDQAMLIGWRYGIHIITPFTNDKAVLKQGVATLGKFGPAGMTNAIAMSKLRRDIDELVERASEEQSSTTPLISWDEAYENSRTIAQRAGEQMIAQEQRLLDDASHIADSMAGLEGKKVFVFVGEHFQENPGAELFRYIENVFRSHMELRNFLNFEAINGVTGNSMPNAIEKFADAASANGVTIYAIGASPTDADGGPSETANPDFSYTFARDANTATALQHIANRTGGVAITRTTNFDLAFDTISKDLSSYYSLGYKPLGEGMRPHKIVVKAKNPAYSVRARQTFITKSTDDQMTDRVVGNLYVDPGHNEWPIAIRTGQARKAKQRGSFIVPVIIEIPSTVTLLPDADDTLAGNITLYFVVGNDSGATSTVLRRPEPIHIPKDREQLAREKPMLFKTAFQLSKGENVLSVGIIDQLSGTMGFARTKIVAR